MATTAKAQPASLAEALELVASMASTIRLLELKVDQLTRRLYGPTSEKLTLEDNQLPLLQEVFAPVAPPVVAEVLTEPEAPAQPKRPRTPRQPVATHLEVIEERVEPQDRVCPHCGQERCVLR